MPIASNDLFKFVSLRRPETALSVDPSEIAPGSVALKLLSDMRVDVANPQPEVLAKLGDVPLLDEPALRELVLEAAWRQRSMQRRRTQSARCAPSASRSTNAKFR